MSIQWALVAGFLYLEIAIVLLLVLPVASPRRWQSLFRSRFLSALSHQATFYFYILLSALVLFLLDAIREMRKYSGTESSKGDGHAHQLDLEMQLNMRLFRAQRNFYISGFSLFLSLVIRRLINLISTLATVEANSEAAVKQAQSASSTARSLIANQGGKGDNEEVTKYKAEIDTLKSEIEKLNKDKEAVVKQSANLSKEYDRLTEEYSKLQKKADAKVGDLSDKKAD